MRWVRPEGLHVTLYFLGLNMTLSVLPLFVEGELGGTDTQVGIAVSSFGLAAACIRPIIGPIPLMRPIGPSIHPQLRTHP